MSLYSHFMMIHDIKDDSVLLVPSQEPSTSSKSPIEGRGSQKPFYHAGKFKLEPEAQPKQSKCNDLVSHIKPSSLSLSLSLLYSLVKVAVT